MLMSERQWQILSLLERLGRGEVTVGEVGSGTRAVKAAGPADAEAVCQQWYGRTGSWQRGSKSEAQDVAGGP